MIINYSIIIPYRDTLDLLYKAVDSIPDRDDIQIIIVDNSLVPLQDYQIPNKGKAEVLFMVSSPIKGAGHARNEGLRRVKGKWILFLDADDYFEQNAFDTFDKYLTSAYDIVFFDANSIHLKDGSPSERHKTIHYLVHSFIKTKNEDFLRYRFVNPIAKMMNASFVLGNGIQFDEVKASNDMMFSIMTGHLAESINADSACVYIITEGEKNTSLTKTHSRENQWDRFQVYIRQYHFMESIGRKDLRFHLLTTVWRALRQHGIKEFFRYIRYAMKERVNLFLFG